ncbi:Pat1p [Sugiyamaella lignohabitans]|uniref:Pat1p n=1 Tax=Sugiyamaella lignohabitans TaxID=796027 RepID=A0A167C1M7_9ASCO|nr:Pat1p [Sugiyamaella lignohabitans]ANB11105.1 Pat1p [Sugiyamaella lignohabitans]
MSFFGVKTASSGGEAAVYEFDDTYDDNLGAALEETNDDFNDETFGDFGDGVGNDFDFAGQTANVADTIDEEQFTFARNAGGKLGSVSGAGGAGGSGLNLLPSTTGSVPSLQPIASLWGTAGVDKKPEPQPAAQQQQPQQPQQPKILSLEEVEAQMLGKSQQQLPHGVLPQPPQGFPPQGFPPQGFFPQGFPPQGFPPQGFPGQGFPQVPQGYPPQGFPPQGYPLPQDPAVLMSSGYYGSGAGPTPGQPGLGQPGQPGQPPHQQQIPGQQQLQQQQQQPQQQQQAQFQQPPAGQSVQADSAIKQIEGQLAQTSVQDQGQSQGQRPQGAHGQEANAQNNAQGNAQTPYSLPQQVQQGQQPVVPLNQVINEDLAQSEAEHQRMFEKSRKIAEIVKYNGLMSQWDKNFIMRIQLQQMVTADPYNEDFYYQVHSAIQARNNPQQPLNEFARTYLLQRGQRGNGRFRRHNDNPLQRMQQQVQRAVAAAKEHPKKEQIAPEGALGKISVGGGKQPRKALNVAGSASNIPSSPSTSSSAKVEALKKLTLTSSTSQSGTYTKKGLLRSIENVYTILLEIESVERSRPSEDFNDQQQQQHQQQAAEDVADSDSSPAATPASVVSYEERLQTWQDKMQTLVDQLWNELQVLEPIDSANNQPFILMLSHDKGKKVIPRIFRHLSQKQRLTVLTRIVAHIESLDVVKDGDYGSSGTLSAKTRESIELFSQTVLPPLVHLVSESSYDVVIGLLEIMLNSSNMVHVSSTKIGLAFLTVLISRAELISQEESEAATPSAAATRDLANWQATFNTLFTKVQGHLSSIFPPRNVDNSYVWHFLASLALAAKLEHQRIIVDEVREMIFGTMNEAKALPVELGVSKIANLNLFLNVMGLNATTTEITELSSQ